MFVYYICIYYYLHLSMHYVLGFTNQWPNLSLNYKLGQIYNIYILLFSQMTVMLSHSLDIQDICFVPFFDFLI